MMDTASARNTTSDFWYSRSIGAVDRGTLSPAVTFVDYGYEAVSTSLSATYDEVGNRTTLTATIGSDLPFQNRYAYDNLYRMTSVTQSFVPDNGNPSVPETGALAVAEKRIDFTYVVFGVLIVQWLVGWDTARAS